MPKTVELFDGEVPIEVIAQSISDIASAMRKIEASRLTRRAVVALIHDRSRVPKKTIETVLDNLSSLEKAWLKPKKAGVAQR